MVNFLRSCVFYHIGERYHIFYRILRSSTFIRRLGEALVRIMVLQAEYFIDIGPTCMSGFPITVDRMTLISRYILTGTTGRDSF